MEHPIFLARGVNRFALLDDGQVFARHVAGSGTCTRKVAEQEEVLLHGRLAQGRYRLEEAAMLIEGRIEATSMLAKLKRAVLEGEISAYQPGRHETYKSAEVREWYEEVYWDELNAWLDANEKRIEWRFSPPAPVSPAPLPVNAAEGGGEAWEHEAQRIALEYIKRHREQNLFPSQRDVCEHVASVTRNLGIFGKHGRPMEPGYIQRNAIQGKWWQQNKP